MPDANCLKDIHIYIFFPGNGIANRATCLQDIHLNIKKHVFPMVQSVSLVAVYMQVPNVVAKAELVLEIWLL